MDRKIINGLSIAYQKKGEGEALVLLHGGLSDSRYWQREIDKFSDQYQVIAWDAPGCGQSDDPPKNFTMDDYADTLAELLDHLDIYQAHMMGISFGGGLAIAFIDRHPDMVKTLILISAYTGWGGSLTPDEVERRLQTGRRQITLEPDEVADLWIPSLFYGEPTEEMIDFERNIISEFHPIGSQIMMEAFAKADLSDTLPKINVPTLLVYGEGDVRSPVEVAKELEQSIPSSQLVLLPKVGHDINIQAPDLFENLIRIFLDAHAVNKQQD